ncbi:hypothetical protein PoB_003630300 [Plakobranchus ocellatus]|uniref:Uncharacterized protein n=1 Tax=Plakobranchus ocellatus TaxID=259542 RepID=A0AAV4ASL2_9GAST|nr:hypothetical protein PoB_003630300 [Plakobranchus ocellatus]
MRGGFSPSCAERLNPALVCGGDFDLFVLILLVSATAQLTDGMANNYLKRTGVRILRHGCTSFSSSLPSVSSAPNVPVSQCSSICANYPQDYPSMGDTFNFDLEQQITQE